MGTKEMGDPCYTAALPDEPMFVLLARDPSAPALVQGWAAERMANIVEGDRPIEDMNQAKEALLCSVRMRKWRAENDGHPPRWRVMQNAYEDAVDLSGLGGDRAPEMAPQPESRVDLLAALEHAINCHSAENGSNTPDWILANFLTGALSAFDTAVNLREKWYGRAERQQPLHTIGDFSNRRGSEAEAMDAHVLKESMRSAAAAGLGAEHSSAIPRRTAAAAGLGAAYGAAEGSKSRSANDYQPGGDHYRRAGEGLQHWDFVGATGLQYLPACASKYVGRWRFKNGRSDLEKALHYTHKSEEECVGPATYPVPELLFRYAADNELYALEIIATWALMQADWTGAADAIKKLLHSENAAQAQRA